MKDRRREFKKPTKLTAQERRRRDFLEKQRKQKRDLTQHARQLAGGQIGLQQEDTMEVEKDQKPKDKKTRRRDRIASLRKHYSNQLMSSEWLVDVPEDLNGRGGPCEGWYVLPRPEGRRCLVVSSGGTTTSRLQNGDILHKFTSELPSGSKTRGGSSGSHCILDCIFHEFDSTYYVLDMMCWKGYLLYDCTAEFRFFWIRTKMAECPVGTVSASNEYRFQFIPYFECDTRGLELAYSQQCPFIRDGLLLYKKMAYYMLGLSPLVITFKDSSTSRYFQTPAQQNVVLMLRDSSSADAAAKNSMECTDTDALHGGGESMMAEAETPRNSSNEVCTQEGLVLGTLPQEAVTANNLRAGDLIRFGVTSVTTAEESTTGLPEVGGLQLQKLCSARRALADSWSKIVFHRAWRAGLPTVQELAAATATSAVAEPEPPAGTVADAGGSSGAAVAAAASATMETTDSAAAATATAAGGGAMMFNFGQ